MMQANAVGVIYADIHALKQVRLTLLPGEIVGIFGATGAGKTSLLRCLAGDLAPSDGWVQIGGKDVREQRVTAFQPQGGNGLARLTVAGHRDHMLQLTDDFDAARFDMMTAYLGLHSEERYDRMSPGQRIKCSSCLCLSLNRPYWILDEPFFGSDPASRRAMIRLLAGLADETHALILATHMTEEVEPLLTRAMILDHGYLKTDLDMEQLRADGLRLADLLTGPQAYRDKLLSQIVASSAGR